MTNKIFSTLTKRNIKNNFKQFISVIVIVFLATMLISGFMVNSFSLDKSVNKYFTETNLADMWILTDSVKSEDENFLTENNIEYAKRFYTETTLKIPTRNMQNNAKIYVGTGKISNPIVSNANYKGCFIDEKVAKNNKFINRHDEIEFDLKFPINFAGTTKIVSLKIIEPIVGTMTFDECADTYSSWPVFIDEDVFISSIKNELKKTEYSSIEENLTMDLFYNQILIDTDDFSSTKTKIEEYYNREETTSNLIYLLSRDSIESVVLLNAEIDQSKKMIYVFPIIFLIVAILVILTTIDQLVIQEKQRIGTLKSIGISDKKILWHYASYGPILCTIGSVLGVILGSIIIPDVMFIKYNLVYSIPSEYMHKTIPIWIIFVIIAGFAILGLIVSSLACLKILHKRPIECLRYDVGYGAKSLKKSSRKNLKLPLSIKMSMRNIRIKPVRTIMASIGIAGCMALLLCGFGIQDTLKYSSKNDLEKVFKYDITTTYSNSSFEQKIENEFSEIECFEKYKKFYVEAKNGQNLTHENLFEIKQNSSLSSIKLSENDVCMSKSIAEKLKIKIGDKFKVQFDGKIVELTLTKVIETSFFNGIYVAKNIGLNDILATKGMWIKCRNVNDDIVEKINVENGTNTAYSMKDMKKFVNNKMSSIGMMSSTLEFFAISLAVVVLINLIFLILKEREREIATLKVLGKNIFSIGLSMFFEILFMSIIGSSLGLILGLPLLTLVLSINKVEVMNFLIRINVGSYFVSLAIILLTILVVSLFCLIKVKKINMIESLKSVE